jgi:hypothetical protein
VRRAALVLLVLALAGGGALLVTRSPWRDDGPAPLRLDGTPRLPDDEGVATSLSRRSITLDGTRTYEVSDQLRSFSTYTLALEPMIGRKGQYVQVGLDGDTMVWMAGVAQVLEVDGERSVYYTGRYVRTVEGRLVFRDGTTIAPGAGVKAPPPNRDVTVRIDAKTHRAVEIR